jgi:hypothetical protein
LLLYFVLIHLLHHIRSLTIPLLWHASRYCWSYGYLREFSMERQNVAVKQCWRLLVSFYDLASRGIPHKLSRLSSFYLVYFLLLLNRIVTINLDKLDNYESFSK